MEQAQSVQECRNLVSGAVSLRRDLPRGGSSHRLFLEHEVGVQVDESAAAALGAALEAHTGTEAAEVLDRAGRRLWNGRPPARAAMATCNAAGSSCASRDA